MRMLHSEEYASFADGDGATASRAPKADQRAEESLSTLISSVMWHLTSFLTSTFLPKFVNYLA